MNTIRRASPEQLSLERPIKTRGLLVVEGRSLEIVLREMIERDELLKTQIEARTFGDKGAANIQKYLGAFVTKVEFGLNVLRLGIIRDAETGDAQQAFQSVIHAIKGFNESNPAFALPVPERLATLTPPAPGRPQVGVFILPDCARSGMLETLVMDAVEETEQTATTKLLPCVNELFGCLERQNRRPSNPTKARLAGYLLAADVIDPQVGRAAQQNAIPWQTKAFEPLMQFVRQVAGGA